ncbi:MAG: hypothetical protein PHU85_16905, partial [Phycisphaerae bacterium]|nr:hypothetical protein [Phycisphaerae bacterium]
SVALGVVSDMAAAGTSTANAAGDGTTAAPMNHVHALGAHDHSGSTKGDALALAALGADFFTADATGRGKFQTGIFDAATVTDLVAADAMTNANCDAIFAASAFAADADSRAIFAAGIWTATYLADDCLSADATGRAKIQTGFFDAATLLDTIAADALTNANCDALFAANAFAADADSRAIFADGIWNAAKLADGCLSADETGRAKIAAAFFNAATCASVFDDNSIPSAKVNWSYGAVGVMQAITPDDSASAGTENGVARVDHQHEVTCAAPADGSLAAANAEGAATSFSRSDHAHRAMVIDAVEFEFGTSYDAVIGWETGDADNHTLVIGLADANQALHIADKTAIATDWNVAADTHPSLYIHSDTTPATDYVKIYHDATSGYINVAAGSLALQVDATTEALIASTGTVFNDASNDRDFRVESNGLQYALYVDGGKDCVVIGDNTDVSDIDVRLWVGNVAKTLEVNQSASIVWIAPTASTTTSAGAGTHAAIASLYVAEPNITAGTGTITNAATVYIANAPTEGVANHALYVASGAATFLGTTSVLADAVDFAIGASSDVVMRWSTGDADNHAFALGLGASLAMHICQGADIATDWDVAAATNPTLYIHGATTPATEYVAVSTDETDAHLNAVGANWKFEIGGTAELTLAANALNLVDSVLYGSAAENGNLVLSSTSHGTKGYVGIADAEEGFRIGGTATRGTVGTNSLHLYVGTAPAGALNNCCSLYAEGADAASEMKAMDAAGNVTVLSPHTDDGDYVIHSYSAVKDETVTIHLEKLVKELAKGDLAKYVEVSSGFVKTARGKPAK